MDRPTELPFDALLRLTEDGTPEERAIVDEHVLDPLTQALQDESVRVRQNAASALFCLGLTGYADARVLPALEWAAEHDEGMIYGHYVVREAAARAIKEIKGRPSSPGPFSHPMGEGE